MTELIPGKRYRFTVEGEAIDTDSIHTLGGWCIMTNREGAVELLPDPLPTTPGSVIQDEAGDVYFQTMTSSVGWRDVYGKLVGDLWIEQAKLTVLFDAGATRD